MGFDGDERTTRRFGAAGRGNGPTERWALRLGPTPIYWAADVLEECGAPLHLAHPLSMKGITSNRRVKNDVRDAVLLADLLRPRSLPEAWIAPLATRELRTSAIPDLARHTRDDLDAVALVLNTRPRKTPRLEESR